MEYLKCEHCGFFNPVKSEYLAFCEKCNKKLIDSYRNWLLRNPEKSFEDYKQIVCVTEEYSNSEKIVNKNKISRVRFLLLGFFVGILFSFALFFVFYAVIKNNYLPYKQQVSLNSDPIESDKKWVTFNSQEGHYSIEFPMQPQCMVKKIPSPVGNLDFNFCGYQNQDGSDENLMYGIGYSTFPSDKINSQKMNSAELENYFSNSVKGSVQNIQGKLLDVEIIYNDSFPGRKFRVDFRNGTAIIEHRLFLVRNTVYDIQVITPTDKTFNKSINKFFNSFKLKN